MRIPARSRRGLYLILWRRIGAFLQGGRWLDRVGPLLEALALVDHVVDVVLCVLELGAPEQGVERADLYADAAVHAQREVDREPVEDLGAARPTTARRLVGLL